MELSDQLSLVPLTGIFAAGNRAMVKMSENSRHLAAFLIEKLPAYFPPEKPQVFDETGGVGIEFSKLPFDHLLFTGSGATGRAVMTAAAQNLVPVTLELGGYYIPDEAKEIYRSKDGKSLKTFDALEWLAAMCSHVPNKGKQMVRYYGYYSNVCRGQRKKADTDGLTPCILQTDESSKGYLKNWARLIQKIYEVDPLTCPKCQGPMAIISFIEAEDVTEKTLKHLGLWEVKPRPPPGITKSLPSLTEPHIDYSDSQVLRFDNGFWLVLQASIS